MLDKIDNYIKLTRLFNPTGYMLLFFPCAFSVIANARSDEDLFYLVVFFIGSVIMRSAGCIINDLTDRHIDRLVARTENRPLASRAVSTTQAVTLLMLLLLCSLIILLTLPIKSWLLGLIAIIMVIIYPRMKRFTYWPQLFLGMTFSLGALFASIAVTNTITQSGWLIYIACIFWTLGYDTIYGYMDHKDDIKAGVKSLSLYLLDKPYKTIISIFYLIFVGIMGYVLLLTSFQQLWLIGIAASALLYQTFTLDIELPSNCMKRFKSNNVVGIIVLLAYALTF